MNEDRDPLKFWKPSLTLDWKGPESWHAQLSAKRVVAQLDFYDFISSATCLTKFAAAPITPLWCGTR